MPKLRWIAACRMAALMVSLVCAGSANAETSIDPDKIDVKVRHKLVVERGVVKSIAFSPDGRFIAAGNGYDVYLFDARSGSLLHALRDAGSVSSATFSPDGQKILTAGDGLIVWDVKTGAQQAVLVKEKGYFYASAFSPKGDKVAVSTVSSDIQIWSLASGRRERRLVGHRDRVDRLVFSPNGATLASASHDNTARIWDVESGARLQKLESPAPYPEPIISVSFSPDGRRLAAVSWRSDIYIWKSATGELVENLGAGGAFLRAIRYAQHAPTFTAVVSNHVQIWSAESLKLLKTLKIFGNDKDTNASAIGQDGGSLATAICYEKSELSFRECDKAGLVVWEIVGLR